MLNGETHPRNDGGKFLEGARHPMAAAMESKSPGRTRPTRRALFSTPQPEEGQDGPPSSASASASTNASIAAIEDALSEIRNDITHAINSSPQSSTPSSASPLSKRDEKRRRLEWVDDIVEDLGKFVRDQPNGSATGCEAGAVYSRSHRQRSPPGAGKAKLKTFIDRHAKHLLSFQDSPGGGGGATVTLTNAALTPQERESHRGGGGSGAATAEEVCLALDCAVIAEELYQYVSGTPDQQCMASEMGHVLSSCYAKRSIEKNKSLKLKSFITTHASHLIAFVHDESGVHMVELVQQVPATPDRQEKGLLPHQLAGSSKGNVSPSPKSQAGSGEGGKAADEFWRHVVAGACSNISFHESSGQVKTPPSSSGLASCTPPNFRPSNTREGGSKKSTPGIRQYTYVVTDVSMIDSIIRGSLARRAKGVAVTCQFSTRSPKRRLKKQYPSRNGVVVSPLHPNIGQHHHQHQQRQQPQLDTITLAMFDHQSGTVAAFVLQCGALGGVRKVCQALAPLLEEQEPLKVMHDLHEAARIFGQLGGLTNLCGMLDTQLAAETLTKDPFCDLGQVCELFGISSQPPLPVGSKGSRALSPGRDFDASEAASDAVLLTMVRHAAPVYGFDEGLLHRLEVASDGRARACARAPPPTRRVSGGGWDQGEGAERGAVSRGPIREMTFDVANGMKLASLSLLSSGLWGADLLLKPWSACAPSVHADMDAVLRLLPRDLAEGLRRVVEQGGEGEMGREEGKGKRGAKGAVVDDIVFDLNRQPHATLGRGRRRVNIGAEGRVIGRQDLEEMIARLGTIGSDNRAGLDAQLHRFSVMRDREGAVVGLTVRVGRHVTGTVAMLTDVLLGEEFRDKSVLFLGGAGSGKTTLVREAARILSEKENVVIVDTSNEIAGDGATPHPCVGHARRMMVPSLEKQGEVMIECVQNHSPGVLVVDEIGRPAEVDNALTCKQRGVRIVASAHGNLKSLVKNPKLRRLVGGIEAVTVGDALAADAAAGRGKRHDRGARRRSGGAARGSSVAAVVQEKAQLKRAAAPVFEVVVEVSKGKFNQCHVVLDTAAAVDEIIAKGSVNVDSCSDDSDDDRCSFSKQWRAVPPEGGQAILLQTA